MTTGRLSRFTWILRQRMWLIGLTLFCNLLFSCQSHKEEDSLSESEYKEHLTNANRIIVRDEKKDIEDFISRHQFRMDSTGTGLRIQLIQKGAGKLPVDHDRLLVAYKVFLLDGTMVYSFAEQQPDTFRIAEGEQVRGLEEAMRLLPEGSRARLLLPAHLAYGMIGDQNKIPGATPLYYDLHFIRIIQ